MENKNIKLILVALGSFMLVLLQTEMFQRSLEIFSFIGLSVIGDIILLYHNISNLIVLSIAYTSEFCIIETYYQLKIFCVAIFSYSLQHISLQSSPPKCSEK